MKVYVKFLSQIAQETPEKQKLKKIEILLVYVVVSRNQRYEENKDAEKLSRKQHYEKNKDAEKLSGKLHYKKNFKSKFEKPMLELLPILSSCDGGYPNTHYGKVVHETDEHFFQMEILESTTNVRIKFPIASTSNLACLTRTPVSGKTLATSFIYYGTKR